MYEPICDLLKIHKLGLKPSAAFRKVFLCKHNLHTAAFASPAWWGFAPAIDQSRIERIIQRTIRMGYLLPESPTAAAMVADAENRLLASVISRPDHVFRPLFPPIIIRRPGLRRRPHDFSLPPKDDSNFIPRILYRTLLILPLILFFVLFDTTQL